MHTHITRDDRVVISSCLRRNESYADIADRLGKNKGAIQREVQRNKDASGAYDARRAHKRSRQRRAAAKYKARKIENSPALSQYIASELHPLVSPEVIAHQTGIAHETIYAWISRSRPDLKHMLPQRGKKRRKYGTKRENKQGWTRNVRSIEERIEREENWEGDTLRGNGAARLLTHVERASLYLVTDLIPNGGADIVHEKVRDRGFSGTSTYDRGSEFALWRMMERDTTLSIYFALPHHPWQRGKNENTNGRLRRVFPKQFDFSRISQKEVDRVVWIMNHTTRKSLCWRTPCAVYGKCCNSE